jgi:quercetin dioxygenase-like cupin family protein
MKRLALLLLTATLLSAQSPEVEITAEPHHHLALENKSVRVFNVEVDPNTETQMHWHRHDYFTVNLGTAEISNTVKDKPPATVKFTDGDTRFASATFAHAVRDLSPQPFRNVTIEILDDATLRSTPSPWDPAKDEDRGLAVLNNGTKQILFVKDAIRATEFELQPGGVIPKHHHAGPVLVVAITDLALEETIEGQPLTPSHPASHMKSGDSKWLPGNLTHTVTNPSTQPAKFVTLEFP